MIRIELTLQKSGLGERNLLAVIDNDVNQMKQFGFTKEQGKPCEPKKENWRCKNLKIVIALEELS